MKNERTTAVWRQWGQDVGTITNKSLISSSYHQDVQHSSLVLKFNINNSNRLLFRLDEHQFPTERQADRR